MSSASAQLPHWPPGTAAVLCVAGPHAIPVSTAIRAGDDRLVFALGRRRDALARLREELERIPLAALELRVERVQDHLADGRTDMLGAAGWRWRGERDAEADRIVHEELAALAAMTG